MKRILDGAKVGLKDEALDEQLVYWLKTYGYLRG